ncbi:MAG: tyrosine--tRNA ligase [Chlamydiota bacterium]|nr:tyrosine--tRNA ligase [Chlamydiota bacterium]
MHTVEEQITAIKRGVIDLIDENELRNKIVRSIANKLPLRIKYGADPSAPDLHLGHTVGLKKLRCFQDLGHIIVFIIGDFTARIGDPSGRSATRPTMTPQDIENNAKTYQEQVFKILDPLKTEVRYNSEWLEKMHFSDVIGLASHCSVAQMLTRDDFSKRYTAGKPISLLEFMYPLVQGYDSVVVNADVEIGGTDQTFNLLLGRDLQREYGQEPQVLVTLPLIEGLDGKMKMSKSYGNYVGLTDQPNDMFGKLMSLPDELIVKYNELLTDLPKKELDEIDQALKSGSKNPKDLKEEMALRIIAQYYGADLAQSARDEFNKIFSKKELPSEIDEVTLPYKAGDQVWIVQLMQQANTVSSGSEARRLLKQGAVSIDGEVIKDEQTKVVMKSELILKVGKRRFRKICL